MKNFNWALFLGCCVISIGIVIAGSMIATKISTVLTGNLSATLTGNLAATVADGSMQQGDFMSAYDAALFLGMDHYDFTAFISSGELDGTYTVIQGNNVFSREKLSQWGESRIAGS